LAAARVGLATARTAALLLLLAADAASCASLNARDAAGNQWRAVSDPADGAQGYLLEHLGPEGLPDPRFGRGGRRQLAISATDDAPSALRVDARGRPWITGASISGGQPQAVILRFLADGQPDLQWGVQGKIQLSPSGLAVKPNDLLPLSDGSVLVAGVAANLEPVRAVVFHLQADGSLDYRFGTAGTWQRAGASEGSTATSLAVGDGGAIAVCVAARGEPAAAEIWSVSGNAPKLVRQQPLDRDSDGEDLRVAWAGNRWVFASGDGMTFAGKEGTLDPVAMVANLGRAAAASAPPDPGQGGFSPFAEEPSAPPSAPTDVDAGTSMSARAALVAAALAVVVAGARRWRGRRRRTVLRQSKLS